MREKWMICMLDKFLIYNLKDKDHTQVLGIILM